MLVIPAIDLIDGKCVRLYQGDYSRSITYTEDPVGQALRFQALRFRRLHLVDLEGARAGIGQNGEAVQRILHAVAIPVEIGGGIRTSEDVAQLLSWGAGYLILGTVALRAPELVTEWVTRWGPDRFMISLDMRAGRLQERGWLEESSIGLEEMLQRISDWGVSQVICTDVQRDGTLEQPNYSAYEDLLGRLAGNVALIAAGGVCQLEHISRLRGLGLAGAVVGRAIYEGQISLEDLALAG